MAGGALLSALSLVADGGPHWRQVRYRLVPLTRINWPIAEEA